jgi:DNA polymerase I-like protein with 3'-5' exonuclease and polymerase domains
MAKRFIHGTNYSGQPRTMAVSCGITVHEAEQAQRRWFAEHPTIKDWHRRIGTRLASGQPISNAFGFGITYRDRPEAVLGEALAWVPQSTVALVINHALLAISKASFAGLRVQLLLQVHDSLTMQVPLSSCPDIFPTLNALAQVVIPYDDPLVIPVEMKASPRSWGDCKDIAKWDNQWRGNSKIG